MARSSKPWWRKDRGAWFVTIDGNRFNLGTDRETAFRKFHDLMAKPQCRRVSYQSVMAIIDAFLDWTQKHRAPRTYEWYRERCQSFCGTLSVTLSVKELTPLHVQRWVDAKACSNGHKRGCIIAVQRPFAWATQMGMIDKSPVAYIEKPRPGKRSLCISDVQFGEMVRLVADQEFQDLLVVAWETGARPQELLRVEARHVDLAQERWVFPPEEAKVKSRPRVVYLNDRALEITRRLVKERPDGCLFRNCNGNAWTRHAVNCRFCRLAKLVGTKYCLYVFRHSFATRLLKAGVDPLTVATLLGHADVSMLGRVYQHLSQSPKFLSEQLRRAAG